MSTTRAPDFGAFEGIEFANVKTGARYRLVRADTVPISDATLATIRRICNEPLIHDFLFRDPLDGQPYPLEKARSFLDWARRGWADGSHFVFLVLDVADRVCGAADVKSADLAAAEIGYWASRDHAGIMTPAVAALCDTARGAGFQSLFAFVKPANARSIAVLERNGFRRETGETLRESGPRLVFRRALR